MWVDRFIEHNLLPDPVLRFGIRRLLRRRLLQEDKGSPEHQRVHLHETIERLKQSPIAVNTRDANHQHYELPAEFYQLCLGRHLKYSCAYWLPGTETLDEAEQNMLELVCERAGITNGIEVLDLGCGWGALSLYMAQKYPGSSFTAISNSRSQKSYIDQQARLRGLVNLRVATIDINDLRPDQQFDRIISIEMFEHLRNYQALMRLLRDMLKPQGHLFVHMFTHRRYTYTFENNDATDWMSRHFFTGGIMPGDDLLPHFAEHLQLTNHWRINGMHYYKTAQSWLANLDKNKTATMALFKNTYGQEASKWWVYWRVFFMSCAELWKYNKGDEWSVSHYLFTRKNG